MLELEKINATEIPPRAACFRKERPKRSGPGTGVDWVRAVCAKLGGKVVVVLVEAPTYLPMKVKITKNYSQV